MANQAADLTKALSAKGPEIGGSVLKQLTEAAINGVGKVPGAKATAARHLQKHGDVEAALDALVTTHVSLAAAQGFVTNLGGFASMAVGLPANMAGVAIVQIRLIATVAHLRSYDIDDPRVRTAMVLCLMGREGVTRLMETEVVPTSPVVIATAPVFDASLDRLVCERVFAELVSKLGGRRAAVLIARRVPLLGGGVSAGLDGYATHEIGSFAKAQFVTRRRLSSTVRPPSP